MIDFYTAATPNGFKVAIALEELGLPYRVISLDLSALDQKKPEFLAINPNGRIPAIVDRDNGDFAVFESGAILIYLAEKAGKLLPADPKRRSQALQWLMFQMGGVGPMMGQVLDSHLAHHEYLADEYSIADISTWPWVRIYDWSGISIEGLPHLQAWMARMAEKPACQKGVTIPPRKEQPDELIKQAQQMVTR